MRVAITENRVEYQSRTYEIEFPESINIEDFEAIRLLIVEGDLDGGTPWETVNASEDIADAMPVLRTCSYCRTTDFRSDSEFCSDACASEAQEAQ